MKLYIKQKVFSWADKFTVKDESGQDKYYVKGEAFSFGKKLHIMNTHEEQVAFIEQKVLSFLPKYLVYVNENQVAEIVKEFSFLRPKYSIKGLGWEINGDFLSHNYEIICGGMSIVSIKKEWMTWGDSYELDIADPKDEMIALSVVLAIDCVMAANAAASAST